MRRLGILGLGLMGGSLGIAVKAAGEDYEVLAYARREETRRKALEMNAADEVSGDPLEIVAQSDLLVCCLPVLTIPDFLADCADAFKDGAVITDVGSTKQKIQERMQTVTHRAPATFIGSHPVCGSEKTGMENASGDLYEGAYTIVTPDADASEREYEIVAELWRIAGSRVVRMDAAEHDRFLARTSHLPHMAASILAAAIGRDGDPSRLSTCCGTGFKDATRLAEGAPEIWKDIVQTNQQNIVAELSALGEQVDTLLDLLRNDDFDGVEDYLIASREARRRFMDAGE